MLPNPEIHEVRLQDYLKILRKRILVIVAFLIVIPSVVVVKVFTEIPIYRATVSILIRQTSPRVTKFEEVYQLSAIESKQYYQTQYKILASRVLLERVFTDLHLSREKDFLEAKDPIGLLKKKIIIEPVKHSQIVLIHVDDVDALRASAIANALAKDYIQYDIETKNIATKEAVVFLETQLTDIKKKLRESEEALNEYIQKNKIVTIPDIEQKSNILLETLKESKSKLETELANNLKRYKEKHPKIIALTAQLAEVNKKIEEETNNLLALTGKLVQYNLLKKEVESNQQLYTSMLNRAKETSVSEKIETSNIQIIDAAKPPDAPYKPQKAKSISISILFALFCGVGFVFFLEYLDSSIHAAEDVRIYLDLPFLGYIPSISRQTKTIVERGLICHLKPTSASAEAYRAVRTSILFAFPQDTPLKSILVTAALPEEGKSMIASNLSLIFNQTNERVVLIDMDMRRPVQNKIFNLEQKNGLSNFLAGNIDLESIIKPTLIRNLYVVTSGVIPPNPSELLSSKKIRQFFDELKSRFDRIIGDSPPILSVADTSLLANIVDGVVLVIKGASTRIEAIKKAKEKILEAKGKVIGVIINNVTPEKEEGYYYYHHYYSCDEQQAK